MKSGFENAFGDVGVDFPDKPVDVLMFCNNCQFGRHYARLRHDLAKRVQYVGHIYRASGCHGVLQLLVATFVYNHADR